MINPLIKDFMHYDPFSGTFVWLKRPNPNVPAGSLAGVSTGDRYSSVQFKGKKISAHRLAFWWLTGEEPTMVDHENGNPPDNRFENIRASNSVHNALNAKRHRAGRLPYASWKALNKKWQARYKTEDNKDVYVGLFSSEIEAHNASLGHKAARKVG